jgi:hypothetical protein
VGGRTCYVDAMCGEEWGDGMGPVRAKGPDRGRGFRERQTLSMAPGGGLVMLYPMLPASSDSVYKRFPCPAETKAIFPVHVARV